MNNEEDYSNIFKIKCNEGKMVYLTSYESRYKFISAHYMKSL